MSPFRVPLFCCLSSTLPLPPPLSFPSYSPPLSRYFAPFLRPIVAARVCLSSSRIPRPLATSTRPSGVRYLSHSPGVSSSTGLPRWSATKHGLIKNENGAGDASGNGISDGDPINAPGGSEGGGAGGEYRVTTFAAIRACRGAREINLTVMRNGNGFDCGIESNYHFRIAAILNPRNDDVRCAERD
jgi:hypothetical protein